MSDGIAERRTRDGGVRYAVRVRRAGHNVFGVFDTLPAAKAYRAAVLAAIASGGPLPAAPRGAAVGAPVRAATIEDAARELIQGAQSGAVRDNRGRTYKPATVRTYEYNLRLHVLPRIGRMGLGALTRGDVRRLGSELAVEQGPAVARGALKSLSVLYRLQVEREVVAINPCSGVRVPAEAPSPARFLTVEEAQRLQAAADADHQPQTGPLIALALSTGMRRGELEALTWDRVDLDARVIHVESTLDRVAGPVVPKGGQTRDVPIGRAMVAMLRRWRLASPAGDRVFAVDLRGSWVRSRGRAALADPQPRFHDLRHTAATHLLAAGLKSHAVANILGHRSAALVDTLYGHALPNELAGAGDRLDAWRAGR